MVWGTGSVRFTMLPGCGNRDGEARGDAILAASISLARVSGFE
jgi:hypothetical protein